MKECIDGVITSRVIGCIIRVHNTLGPGFLETIYRRSLLIELHRQNLQVEPEKEVLIYYDGHEVGCHRLDFLVEGRVVVELKSVDTLSKAHYAQVRSYLRATSLSVGLLVNFSATRADFRRIETP